MNSKRPRPKIGVVLSGGGSRGAYEVGILHYLRTDFARRLGRHVPIDIVTGTSVGAINAAFMAATASNPDAQSHRIVDAWRALRIEEMIGFRPGDLLRGAKLLLGGVPPPPAVGDYSYGGLLNTTGLERFVIRRIPWGGIERSLRSGALSALAVSTTHVGTGHTVVFSASKDPVKEWSRDPFVRHRSEKIGPRHVLASAAIPILFPAVKIGEEYFTDGGLRQNTPMSPAIRLGAEKLLVISLRHIQDNSEEMQRERTEAFPKPLFVAGKALNALLLDHTEYDLARMSRINAILAAGQKAFGDAFAPMINQELVALRGAPLRTIEPLHIRPSEDIGALAAQYVNKGKVAIYSPVAKRLLARLSQGESAHESDLLSYLLFDGGFAEDLIEMGRADAARKEEALLRFFADTVE